jgi:hypothetical protein
MIGIKIRFPQAHELSEMYHQRWTVLRQPLGKLPGNERDHERWIKDLI